jgi:hypothetical protein
VAADGVKSPAQAAFRGHDREPAQALLKPVSQVRILPGALSDQRRCNSAQYSHNYDYRRGPDPIGTSRCPPYPPDNATLTATDAALNVAAPPDATQVHDWIQRGTSLPGAAVHIENYQVGHTEDRAGADIARHVTAANMPSNGAR